MYLTYYLLGFILLPGILFAFYAQGKVNSSFKKYNDMNYSHPKLVHERARFLLDSMGCSHVKITYTSGHLTDHYNPKTETVALSSEVYKSTSVASLGIACHEIGHVLQKKQGYPLMILRTLLVPIINIGSFLMWPLAILGLALDLTIHLYTAQILIISAIVIFGISVLFSIITIPIEKDASKRAYKMLVETGELTEEEGVGVKAVLDSAALTYIASFTISLLSFVRFLLYIFISRKRD